MHSYIFGEVFNKQMRKGRNANITNYIIRHALSDFNIQMTLTTCLDKYKTNKAKYIKRKAVFIIL